MNKIYIKPRNFSSINIFLIFKYKNTIEHFPYPPSMRSCSLNMLSFNQNSYTNSFQQLQSYQQLVAITTGLQDFVMKQQVVINTLLAKQQQIEEKLQVLNDRDSHRELYEACQPPSIEAENLEKSETGFDEKLYNKQKSKPQIIRRNGFKPLKETINFKEDDVSVESEISSGSGTPYRVRRNPSKAKHLWVNYGRRIVDYAITQTEGEVQEKVKKLTGKLNSKRDFEKTFEFISEDSTEERYFKDVFGKLAIDFVKNKCSSSFEGAKYKDQMIEQRHVVAAWIEKLTSIEN